jgi:hypothetical protein
MLQGKEHRWCHLNISGQYILSPRAVWKQRKNFFMNIEYCWDDDDKSKQMMVIAKEWEEYCYDLPRILWVYRMKVMGCWSFHSGWQVQVFLTLPSRYCRLSVSLHHQIFFWVCWVPSGYEELNVEVKPGCVRFLMHTALCIYKTKNFEWNIKEKSVKRN